MTGIITAMGRRHESAAGTDVTTVGPSINASPTPGSPGKGRVFSITAGGQINCNGVLLGGTAVTELYYINHTCYQKGSNQWWGPMTSSSVGTGPLADPHPVADEGSHPFLVGLQTAGLSQSYTSIVGMHADFENDGANGTYVGMDGANANYGDWRTNGFPVIFSTSHFADSNNPTSSPYTNPTTASTGGYDSVYPGLISAVGDFAQYIYAIRIDWEWAGNWYPFSPFAITNIGSGTYASPWITAATYVKGFRRMVDVLRADSRWANVKIFWDYPLNWSGAGNGVDVMAYYPAYDTADATYGAASAANGGAYTDKTRYVDIIGDDPYFGINDGANSAATWSNRLNGFGSNGWGLNGLATFAALRSKPIGFMEWGDAYTDGLCIDNFANWLKVTVPTMGTKCVLLSYFNGGASGPSVSLTDDATRKAHYITAFGSATMGTSYTGSYWTPKSNSNPPTLY